MAPTTHEPVAHATATDPGAGPDTTHGPGPAIMGANTLLGNDVVDTHDEPLGNIKEIMIDVRAGRVGYAVLAFGGFLGMGEKLFAVPWDALKLDLQHKRFVLDVDKDRLRAAPGFDRLRWPDTADQIWAAGIHPVHGPAPGDAGPRL